MKAFLPVVLAVNLSFLRNDELIELIEKSD